MPAELGKDSMDETDPDKLHPVLPLKDIVVFPKMVVPLFVGRSRSVAALNTAKDSGTQVVLASQLDEDEDNPDIGAINRVAVIANVIQVLTLPKGPMKALVEGVERVRVSEYVEGKDFLEARIEPFVERPGNKGETKALMRTVGSEFVRYAKFRKTIPDEALAEVGKTIDAATLADLVAGHLGIDVKRKQEVLEIDSVSARLEKVFDLMRGELSVIQVERKIRTRVKKQMAKSQREYYLNEQMKAIQKELGDGEDGDTEVVELRKRIAETKLSAEAREKAQAELKKFKNMNFMSAEATVVRNYMDWLLGVPWGRKSRVKKDLAGAQRILDAEHYGLEKIKERIVEYLAVQQRSRKLKGPILCLVGPPGVGKTSLGRSVAKATGREFIRISLGGVRDESEIRGHRRTYIGSMPGKIIQSMKKAKTTNPLIMLDEIDKMGHDFRGDPASALLEVLDPEQNSAFVDHYLEVDYDLSGVMFLTTSNSYNMPSPLLDRMEIIDIAGYTEDEKREIAKRHLIPKILKNHALKKDEFGFSDETLTTILRHYTREAGVRNLEREMEKVVRKVVTKLVKGQQGKDSAQKDKSSGVGSVTVSPDNLDDFLGVRKHKFGLAEEQDQVGVVTGLAYTNAGGDLLAIESLRLPGGKGRMKTTGTLGEVMKESIAAASSYVRSIGPEIGVRPTNFEKWDIHVHVPEGATPKDGPSAGLAMVTSIVSVLTGIPVRKDIAMTGEVTLRGNALPIGGLKEKLLAAMRGGIKTVLIPKDNEKDLADIPDNVKSGLEIIPVGHVNEVMDLALLGKPEPVEWDEAAEAEAMKSGAGLGSDLPGGGSVH